MGLDSYLSAKIYLSKYQGDKKLADKIRKIYLSKYQGDKKLADKIRKIYPEMYKSDNLSRNV